MKTSEIKTGKTYVNKGAGKTRRTVIEIGNEHRPETFNSINDAPNEPGVLYEQSGKHRTLYLSSFAQWCGKES